MKTYKKLYEKLCTNENLQLAYENARKGKAKKESVINFENNVKENLEKLQQELTNFTYIPEPHKRFIVNDPKTRTIHASAFKDRIVHHMLVNILEPIFERIFIHDSYASRKNKGTKAALERFDYFKRKVSKNGFNVRGTKDKNRIQGYCLKADIKHYFENVDHEILINIIKKRVKDGKVIWLTRKILDNFDARIEFKGIPLGNYTSQFFANVYLNELDYFVKHELKAKYYIRYVDDFVILHRNKKRLEYFKVRIAEFLRKIRLELHPDKSDIIPLQKGIDFLGYKVFYKHKILRKRNRRYFLRKFKRYSNLYDERIISDMQLISRLQGWFGYAQWADTYLLRKDILRMARELFIKHSSKKIEKLNSLLKDYSSI